jgi:zinc transport system permease protein
MEDFLLRALLAGVVVAAVAGPYGCVLVWRRMAFFGTTLSHGAILGVALGLWIGISPWVAIVLFCVAAAAAFLTLQRTRLLAQDTLLAVVAHAGLALGLVLIAFQSGVRVDLMSYLFGDILAVSATDLWVGLAGGAAALAVAVLLWRGAIAVAVDADLARIDGIRVGLVDAAMTLMMALVIAGAIRLVGILLVVSLLIIPAATARRFARTPEAMATLASLVGALAVALGLGASLAWDTPAGPSIVVAASLAFVLAWLVPHPDRG